nr:hypothetical protein [Tanacetum cinerariifolium]
RYYGEESAEAGPPGVIVYGYDGLPMQPIAIPSPNYVPGPEHPPSPNYVPGPEHPLLPVYVPEPEYPEYLVPSEDEAPMEDQPLLADALPVALSPGYDHTNYPADEGDGDDEPFDDDDDNDEEDEEDQDEEEEEHLAPADSSVVPIVDLVSPAGDREAFETNEHDAALTPSLHVPYPPLPLPLLLTTSPTDAGAPLGYRAVGIRMRSLLPSTFCRTNIPEADMPPQKRDCLTTLAPGFEVGESSPAGAARQPGPTLESDRWRYRVEQTGYGITNTWDEIVDTLMEIAPTTLKGINQRVKDLAPTVR